MMVEHTHTKTEGPAVRLDERLLGSYAASLMRLIVFTEHCGPGHPCVASEPRLFRRYDAEASSRHASLNSETDRRILWGRMAAKLVDMSGAIVLTLDLEPEFAAEVLEKFAASVRARFSP